ncbi:MAG: MATE family efflux transporter, partial [Lachnospiraceae bacterium]|nr:MATE family efflux transporter [Lachnospiraceae bacterium]
FSTTAVAFFGVYYKLQNFLFMPMNGLGQGSLPIVGYNYGAKDMERVKQTSKMAIATGALIGAVGTIVFLIIPEYLLQLFAASAEMTDMGVSALRIISITFILAAVTMITGYIISGLGNGTVNMIAAALRQIILLIPCVFILGTVGGISMVWFAFWISEAGALIYSVFQIRKYFSKLDVHVVHP